MILAEFLALLLFITLLVTCIVWSFQYFSYRKKRAELELKRLKEMQDQLLKALDAKSYSKLQDWILLYGDSCDESLRQRVETRRDELFIDADDAKVKTNGRLGTKEII